MVMFICPALDKKKAFEKIGPKSKLSLSDKFGIQTNLNLSNSMMIFTLSFLDLQCKFEASFFQKIKFVNDKTWCLDWFWYGVSDGYTGYFFFSMEIPFYDKIDETWCLG